MQYFVTYLVLLKLYMSVCVCVFVTVTRCVWSPVQR